MEILYPYHSSSSQTAILTFCRKWFFPAESSTTVKYGYTNIMPETISMAMSFAIWHTTTMGWVFLSDFRTSQVDFEIKEEDLGPVFTIAL